MPSDARSWCGECLSWETAGKKCHQVYEVAYLTDDSSASLSRIVDPMRFSDRPGIHAVVHEQRFVSSAEELLQLYGKRRESTIKTHHQDRLRQCPGPLICLDDVLKLAVIQTQWLFAENVLAGVQCGNNLSGMQVVSRSHHHGIDVGMMDHIGSVGGCKSKPVLPCHMRHGGA